MNQPHLTTKQGISSAGAAAAIAAASAEATEMAVPITVVMLDEAGNPKALSRMDGAPLVSIQTATNKAYAAVAIGMPPDNFFNAIKDDAAPVASLGTRPGLALVAGSLPVVIEGAVLGGLGVAGAMTGGRIAGSRNKPSLQ